MKQRSGKIKCLLVDDEPLSRELIVAYINKIPDLEIVGECGDVIEAKQLMNRLQVDLLFLDIEMPSLSGIDFLRMLKNPPVTILITAYSNYAVESYELDVADYLLKPVEFDRFFKAVCKAMELLAPSIPQKPKKTAADSAKRSEDEQAGTDYFFVKSDKNILKVRLKDILYIESLREYVKIVTTEQQIITLQSMSRLQEILPSDRFVRIHRSSIINIEQVDKVKGNEVFIGNKTLAISKSQREHFLSVINEFGLF
ncbi:MAG: LytTR family DNA-binding domain-containing protein [Cytophagales bacterium]|nr:LytTR family DNA-binding domain-containing protein [Cytophagales bacterium]